VAHSNADKVSESDKISIEQTEDSDRPTGNLIKIHLAEPVVIY